MGIFIYLAADQLGKFLVEEQVRPAMAALIAADKQAISLRDRHAVEFGIAAVATAINGDFRSGSQVPPDYARLETGMYFGKSGFVYVQHDGFTVYSLSGSSRALRHFLDRIASLCATAGAIGLIAAFAVAWLLTAKLAAPMIRLASAIRPKGQLAISIPGDLLLRRDEIGLIGNAVGKYQQEAVDFLARETAFTGFVSHELRTPLAVLRGALEILDARNHEASLAPVIERMNRTLERMTATVEALLCLARKTGPPPVRIDINGLLDTLISEMQGCAIKMMAEKQVYAAGQPELAIITLRNLLENACFHSKGAVVAIHVSSAGVEIINNMEPLPANENCPAQASGSHAGAGLGLSLAERACERLGWRLDIRFKDGKAHARLLF